VEGDHNLDGGGPGPGSSNNLTLDLVSAAATNAPSLIKKMTRGRYWLLCLLMADFVAEVGDYGQRWILARVGLSAYDLADSPSTARVRAHYRPIRTSVLVRF
jgi:hypothetical protein